MIYDYVEPQENGHRTDVRDDDHRRDGAGSRDGLPCSK
jgi:hypothetical protein